MGLISNGTTIFDNGSMASGFGGSMKFIKKLTASSSATLSFVDGTDGVVLDDTYKEYMFTFNNIHPATNNVTFTFNMSADAGSNYNVTKTTTHFRAIHGEGDSPATLNYNGSDDMAQGTGFQNLYGGSGNDNDQCISGNITIYQPSSSVFVKHFIAQTQGSHGDDYSITNFIAGYGNTTSAIDAIQFKFSSGNIDAGDICLYGIV